MSDHKQHRLRFRLAKFALIVVLTLTAVVLPATSVGQPAPSSVQVTALHVGATNAPVRVLGSDGMEHLEYDLLITNVFTAPVTLTAIEVIAPDGRALLQLNGDSLAAVTQPIFAGPPTREVPVAGAVAVVMDVIVPPGGAPTRIGHRIAYAVAPDAPGRALIGSLVVEGPELAVDGRAAMVLAPPLRGGGWLNGSGCCLMTPHRVARLVVEGMRYVKPETFAIDWLQMRGGRLFEGDGARVEQWYGYGAELLAVADGTVVHVRDGMPEETPGLQGLAVRTSADYAGNTVVLEIRPGVFAHYAHLIPGSLRVNVGDRVTAGEVLGLLGNTGNSSAPHLHFGIQDGPEIVSSNSLPFVFDRYTLQGTITEADLDAASTGPDPAPVSLGGSVGVQDATHPLYLTVIGFP
jgi:hypothetical protein